MKENNCYYLYYREKKDQDFDLIQKYNNKMYCLQQAFKQKKEFGGSFYVLDKHGIVVKRVIK